MGKSEKKTPIDKTTIRGVGGGRLSVKEEDVTAVWWGGRGGGGGGGHRGDL